MTLATDFYTEQELEQVHQGRVPQHIAIIPDGNRRWATSQAESTQAGHTKGADTLLDVVEAAKDLGVKFITTYAFSTENWERPQGEVNALMSLLEYYLRDQTKNMVANGVHLKTIGDLSRFPESVRNQVAATKEATKDCHDITLVLALNYGARDEMVRAVRSLVDDYAAKGLNSSQISEESLASHLDTAHLPDPDLLIRTSGEMRISNFLLWQLSYSELYLTDTLWPDFSPKHLLDAVLEFQNRERRLGQ